MGITPSAREARDVVVVDDLRVLDAEAMVRDRDRP